MYNWSTDEQRLSKNHEKHTIWKLEQLINFGLGREKINRRDLDKYFNKIEIDSARRRFLQLLLYGIKDFN